MGSKYIGCLLLESYNTGDYKRQKKTKGMFNDELVVLMIPYIEKLSIMCHYIQGYSK